MIRHLTASAVVIDPHARAVLLVWHRAMECWVLPGGHIEGAESPAQAAIREVAEETGVRAVLLNDHVLDAAVYPAPAKPERKGRPAEDAHEHIDLLYVAIGNSGRLMVPALDEVADVRWQPVSRLGELPVRAEVPRVVALAARRLGLEEGR